MNIPIPKRNTRSNSQSSTPESSNSRVELDVQENVEETQSTSSSLVVSNDVEAPLVMEVGVRPNDIDFIQNISNISESGIPSRISQSTIDRIGNSSITSSNLSNNQAQIASAREIIQQDEIENFRINLLECRNQIEVLQRGNSSSVNQTMQRAHVDLTCGFSNKDYETWWSQIMQFGDIDISKRNSSITIDLKAELNVRYNPYLHSNSIGKPSGKTTWGSLTNPEFSEFMKYSYEGKCFIEEKGKKDDNFTITSCANIIANDLIEIIKNIKAPFKQSEFFSFYDRYTAQISFLDRRSNLDSQNQYKSMLVTNIMKKIKVYTTTNNSGNIDMLHSFHRLIEEKLKETRYVEQKIASTYYSFDSFAEAIIEVNQVSFINKAEEVQSIGCILVPHVRNPQQSGNSQNNQSTKGSNDNNTSQKKRGRDDRSNTKVKDPNKNDQARSSIKCKVCGGNHFLDQVKCHLAEHRDANRNLNIEFLDSIMGKKYKAIEKSFIVQSMHYDETSKSLVRDNSVKSEKKQFKGKNCIELNNIDYFTTHSNPLSFFPTISFKPLRADRDEYQAQVLVDTGALHSNFISLAMSKKLHHQGYQISDCDKTVGMGVVGMTDKIIGYIDSIDCIIFNNLTNKNEFINFSKSYITNIKYDFIIGRPDICKHNLYNKLHKDVCVGCHSACSKGEPLPLSDLEVAYQDLSTLVDSEEPAKIDRVDFQKSGKVHSYQVDEFDHLLSKMKQDWIEVNKFSNLVEKGEKVEELNSLHTDVNPKRKIDVKIEPLPGIKNGDIIPKWDLLKEIPPSDESISVKDLKYTDRPKENVKSDIEILNIEISQKDSILRAIEFAGAADFQQELIDLVSEYIDIFSPKLDGKEPAFVTPLVIEIDSNKWEDEKNRQRPRLHSDQKQHEIKVQVELKGAAGIIKKSEAQAWSQVHMVSKGDGTYRMTIDYRLLNECIESKIWPLPMIDQVIREIGSARPEYFGVMDMTEGYFQMPLDKNSTKWTAFYTKYGLFEWLRVPMGLKSAGTHFQRCMETEVLDGIVGKTCQIYQDDVTTYAKTKEEFIKNLRNLFERFREHNIKLSPKKCRFGASEEKLLGHVINKHGYTFSREKLQGVMDFRRPRTYKELQKFLGLCNYFRSHTKDHANLSIPLYNLMTQVKDKKAIYWTPESEKAFETLKKAIWDIPTLFFVDKNAPVYLQTDASDFGIAAYLFQIVDGKEVVIGLYSKALSGHELNWSIFEKEAYAIFMGLRKFDYLLADVKFTIRTDHRNLLYMNNDASKKVIGWKMEVQSYDFNIEHVAGKYNIVPDDFSRFVEPLNFLEELILGDSNISDGEGILTDFAMKLESACQSYNQVDPGIEGTLTDHLSCMYLEPDVQEHCELTAMTPGTVRVSSASKYLESKILDTERYALIEKFHNSVIGHHGISRTVQLITEHDEERHNNLRRDVDTFIRQCEVCQLARENKPSTRSTPFHTSVFGPMERISIDSIGPLSPDEDGNCYIIAIIDIFSRFTSLYAVPDLSAIRARRCIVEHIGVFGVPLQILTDKGTQFHNNLVDELFDYLGIDNLKTMPYSHQENAVIERSNRTSMKHLRAIVYDNYVEKKWAQSLPLVERIINSMNNDTTGFPPAYIMFGTRVDLNRGILASKVGFRKDQDMSVYMKEMILAQGAIINQALANQEKANKKHTDRKSKDQELRILHQFKPNSFVLVNHETGRPSKLSFINKGPFQVISHVDDKVTVQNLISLKREIFHVNQVTPYLYDSNRVTPSDVARKALVDKEYLVDKILDHNPKILTRKTPKRDMTFLVKWTGFEGEDSWEPWSNLRDTDKLHEYLKEKEFFFLLSSNKASKKRKLDEL